jgi:hypothetical protein
MTIPIPYVALREGEQPALASHLQVRPDGRGLTYRTEHLADRFRHGVLWARCSGPVRGDRLTGRPIFDQMHPRRQRRAMTSLLCQVCTQPADRNELGLLFLTVPPGPDDGRGWPEGMRTDQPPVCLAHAEAARKHCRPLVKEGAVAVRVTDPVPYGVKGSLYRYGPAGPEPVALPEPYAYEPLPFTDKRLLPWFLASHLVAELRGVTVVDLDEEIAAAQHGAHVRGAAPVCPISGGVWGGVGR